MTNNTQAAIEITVAATASKATYLGSGASVFGALASIDWLALAGFFIALVGLAINFYFSYQRNKRERAEHEIKMRKLKDECHAKQD